MSPTMIIGKVKNNFKKKSRRVLDDISQKEKETKASVFASH